MSKSEQLPDEGWFRFSFDDAPMSDVAVLMVGIHPSLGPAGYREVGTDPAGNVFHRCPDDRFPLGTYGWFDPHAPPVSEATPITAEEFEAAWALEDLPSVRRSWRDRFRLGGRNSDDRVR
jgi:hypothetical protein